MTRTDLDGELLSRARQGHGLSADDLHRIDQHNVLSLGMLADEVRRSVRGPSVTVRRVATVPSAGIGAEWARMTEGADEVRISHIPDSREATLTLVTTVRAATPETLPVWGFSLEQLTRASWFCGRGDLEALAASGLTGVVDAAVDVVSPTQVAEVFEAGLAVGLLSVEQPVMGDRVLFVEGLLRFLAAESRVRRVAPLPKQVPVATPTTGYQDVRLVAMTTIGLPMLEHVVVDWLQYGPKLAQVALTFGATYLDNVSTVDDPALGRRRTHLEDVRRNITAAGLTPAERTDAA
ncbi:MAG: hypothetical protein FJW29_08495 [Acidobacteria bacterium]|nr:hypothetical protein [Acidobacteriota bacterium]